MDQVKILPFSTGYHTCTKGLLQLGGQKTKQQRTPQNNCK